MSANSDTFLQQLADMQALSLSVSDSSGDDEMDRQAEPVFSSYSQIVSGMGMPRCASGVAPRVSSDRTELNATDAKGNTKLHRAILDRQQENIHPKDSYNEVICQIRCLLEKGLDPNIQNKKGDTVLHLMAELPYGCYGDASIFTDLLKHGAKANIPNKQGVTPLHCLAAAIPYSSIISMLITQGMGDVNALDLQGQTPLHYLANTPHGWSGGFFEIKVALVLLEHKVIVDKQNCVGESAFHIAVRKYSSLENVMQFFIHHAHADLNLPNKAGDTPFLLLAGYNKWDKSDHTKFVKLCLEHGANKTTQNKKGERAIDKAKKRNGSEVIDLLEIPEDSETTATIEPVSAIGPR